MIASTVTHIDWPAVRVRLASVTSDPAAMTGLDRLAETGELDDRFLDAVVRLDLSLDWLLLGKGDARQHNTA